MDSTLVKSLIEQQADHTKRCIEDVVELMLGNQIPRMVNEAVERALAYRDLDKPGVDPAHTVEAEAIERDIKYKQELRRRFLAAMLASPRQWKNWEAMLRDADTLAESVIDIEFDDLDKLED